MMNDGIPKGWNDYRDGIIIEKLIENKKQNPERVK